MSFLMLLRLAVSTLSGSGCVLGQFTRPNGVKPVIEPDPASVFDCPMRGKPIRWEAKHTFNPAAIVKDNKVWLLYRAEDDSGNGIATFTSRLGLASSDDGIHFKKHPKPVLYPDNDDQKDREWEGGCEDPRCVELEDGSYALFYTQYHRINGSFHVNLGMATSKDLIHWTKTGPVQGLDVNGKMVTPTKSASLVTSVKKGRLIATKIDGKYWLYYGEGDIYLMTSPDLRSWTPVPGFVVKRNPYHFDSGLAECGPPAVLTSKGIVLLYNGSNASGADKDPSLPSKVYSGGQFLFDRNDPTRLISRSEKPFFKPELPWEKTGQFKDGTTFIEGLVLFHKKWLLYYGAADTFVGVAQAPYKPEPQPGASPAERREMALAFVRNLVSKP
jgi:predicted GH43/DUF377 family glycosyl hydrolase